MNKKFIATLALFLMMPSATSASIATCGGNGWNCYKNGMTYMSQGNYEAAVKELESAVKLQPGQASLHSELAKAYEKVGKFQLASDHYNKQSQIYKDKNGDPNTYLAAKRKADELNSTISFYQVVDATPSTAPLAKYEPTSGAYIGAFIGLEEKYHNDQYSGYGDNENEFLDFNATIGKKHATFFDYASIGSSLNASFMSAEKDIIAADGALHVAYEPNGGLQEVTESAITAYAHELADLGVPVFLRYASEMNGDWVAWHGNPELYIQKWHMVHDIMAEIAPNVAMVWSPSEMPLHNIDTYYPGDAYVDWVGISIYSAQFQNGDASQPTDRRDPLEAVDFIYEKYADRKPIMISEYAASHQAGYGTDKQDTARFATTKMRYFYESIQSKYPRVKCIQWYSVDNYNLDDPSKNRVNYSLLEGTQNQVLSTYKEIVSDDYFLSDVVNGPFVETQSTLPKTTKEVTDSVQVTQDVTFRTFVKSYDPYIREVVYKLNGVRLPSATKAPYEITIPYAQLQTGENSLEAVVFDSNGNVAKQEKITLMK